MATPTTSLVPTLDGRYYTSPEVFDLECERIFRRSWMCVGRADALPDPGDFLRAESGGESLLVVRGQRDPDGGAGPVRAFRNLCRHRGTRLCVEQQGNVGKAIRCMYHAWTYGLDGALLAAPNMRAMPDLVRADYGLHPVGVEEWLGYLWVNLDPAAAPLSAQVRPQLVERLGTTATLDRYGIAELGVAHTAVYEVEANWKALVENFTECYHCASIHPELTAALPQFATGYGSISRGIGAELAGHVDGFSLSGRADRPPLPGLLPSDDRLFYGVILRPNVFLILVPDHVAVYRLEPRSATHTTVTVDWLFDRTVLGSDGFDPSDAIGILEITNQQDFEACRRCQLGMRSEAFAGVLVPSEHRITDFHGYVRAALGEP